MQRRKVYRNLIVFKHDINRHQQRNVIVGKLIYLYELYSKESR